MDTPSINVLLRGYDISGIRGWIWLIWYFSSLSLETTQSDPSPMTCLFGSPYQGPLAPRQHIQVHRGKVLQGRGQGSDDAGMGGSRASLISRQSQRRVHAKQILLTPTKSSKCLTCTSATAQRFAPPATSRYRNSIPFKAKPI